MSTDYYTLRARAHRLQAEALRCEAESDRLYGPPCADFADDKRALAAKYDQMAADIEAEGASFLRRRQPVEA